MANAGFIPIIEPVKENFNGLERTLAEISKNGGKAIVIVNPIYGDHAENQAYISQLMTENLYEFDNISAGIIASANTSPNTISDLLQVYEQHNPVLIHYGFTDPKFLVSSSDKKVKHNIFIDQYCTRLYRKHFNQTERTLVRDGFKKRKNSEYPAVENFSELHVTYQDEGMDSFGDFLIVGDEYSEGGGPAYAVAIHLTMIDSNKDDEMLVYHFVSTTNDTPTDPAGKFGQALDKLIAEINSQHSQFYESSAIQIFRHLHSVGHFPGLAMVKKLSMQHHIETLANYFRD